MTERPILFSSPMDVMQLWALEAVADLCRLAAECARLERKSDQDDKTIVWQAQKISDLTDAQSAPVQEIVALEMDGKQLTLGEALDEAIAASLRTGAMRLHTVLIAAQNALYTTPPAVHRKPLTDDTRRLDALTKNSWDLRCFDMSDEDIGWRVIEHHMAKPHERTVAEVFRDDPRQAIDAAIEAAHGI